MAFFINIYNALVGLLLGWNTLPLRVQSTLLLAGCLPAAITEGRLAGRRGWASNGRGRLLPTPANVALCCFLTGGPRAGGVRSCRRHAEQVGEREEAHRPTYTGVGPSPPIWGSRRCAPLPIASLVGVCCCTKHTARLRWFDSISYLIGGRRFSSNDIEHGVLRGNKPR